MHHDDDGQQGWPRRPDPFDAKVIEIIGAIPPGSVTTYGIIAAAAGDHRGARQVARVLHSQSRRRGLPWHRVVNARRKISPRRSGGHVAQRRHLEREGVEFDSAGEIDFDRFLWLPGTGPGTDRD